MSFPVPVKYKLTATLDNIVVEYSNGQEWEGLPSPPEGGGGDTFAQICNGTLSTYESDTVEQIPPNVMRNNLGVLSMKVPNLKDIGSYGLSGFQGTVIALQGFTGSIYAQGFAFNGCPNLITVDMGTQVQRIVNHFFNGASKLNTLIIRSASVATLQHINAFANTPFADGKAGGALYVPADLIETYRSSSNWSTILGYENNSIHAIEGSIYENAYADGTPI